MEPRVLGDYTLIKQIGKGSLGTVFLAEHKFMRRHYALKVLPEDLATDRGFIQRFEDEVRRLAALDHPHIVKIHNVSFAQGVYFLVTDCVVDSLNETTNLAQFIATRGEPLQEDEILNILRQVADALDYAHGLSLASGAIIHRSLKLNNILIGWQKQQLQIHLSDFGLSRIVGAGNVLSRTNAALASALSVAERGESRQAMLHNAFVQAYAFLAPEQKRASRQVDAKVDVFAFGILAYFLLTREFPEGVFPLPSEVAPDFRLNWDTLVHTCLQMNPSKRPGSLLEALDGLEQPRQEHAVPVSEPVVALQTAEEPIIAVSAAAVINTRPQAQVTSYQPKTRAAEEIEPLPTDRVIIEGGTFVRGSKEGNRDEMPPHEVHLRSFAIDTHPVTNEQFVRFLEYMGGEKDSHNHDLVFLRESRLRRSSGKLVIESGYAKHPVVGVTWYGAVAYAQWLGARLPTEAEWEVAAMGGLDRASYPTGDGMEKTQANFFSSDTTAVMSYPPNGNGLYDMAGNVYEWCQDWYGYNFYETSAQEPDNPTGPHQGVYRVLRGGGWKSLKEDLRCASRHRNKPGFSMSTYGLRCVQDVT